jgi:hypothetical protein
MCILKSWLCYDFKYGVRSYPNKPTLQRHSSSDSRMPTTTDLPQFIAWAKQL